MILKLGMKHQGEELYKVYINHNLGMTLTYFIYPSSQVSVYRTIGPLVIICSEFLANKIRHNKNIKGIKIKNSEHKISKYADDTSVFLDGSKNL